MSSTGIIIGVVAAGIILAVALAKKAGAEENGGNGGLPPPSPGCTNLTDIMKYYYFTYTGPAKTFKAALGDCYDVTYTIDIYNADEDDWYPPVDPVNDILAPGTRCRVMVQEPCELCNFGAI